MYHMILIYYFFIWINYLIKVWNTEVWGLHMLGWLGNVSVKNMKDLNIRSIALWVLCNKFILFLFFKTVCATLWPVLLVFANSGGNSEIFVWDAASSQFKSAWKGSPYLSLQPVTVKQSSNTLNLLASAGVTRQESPYLLQVAQVADGSDFVPR